MTLLQTLRRKSSHPMSDVLATFGIAAKMLLPMYWRDPGEIMEQGHDASPMYMVGLREMPTFRGGATRSDARVDISKPDCAYRKTRTRSLHRDGCQFRTRVVAASLDTCEAPIRVTEHAGIRRDLLNPMPNRRGTCVQRCFTMGSDSY